MCDIAVAHQGLVGGGGGGGGNHVGQIWSTKETE